MKAIILSLVAAAGTLAPQMAFAGWGAISCDQDSNCSVSYGWGSLGAAEVEAMSACQSDGSSCYIYQWEHNMCIYGPNGCYACN